MIDIGMSELLVVGTVALIVIGPKDLPELFRSLGRMTAKLRAMSREFSRAMEAAANESGVKDVAADLRKATSAKSMGLDAVKDAAAKFEKWDPLKTAPRPKVEKPADASAEAGATADAGATPPATTPPATTPSAKAPADATPISTNPPDARPVLEKPWKKTDAEIRSSLGPSTRELAERQAARKAIAKEAAEKLAKPAAEAPAAADPAAAPARKPRAPRKPKPKADT